MKKLFLLIFCFASLLFADAVDVSALAKAGATMRDNQLGEIRDILRGGYGGYIDFGFNYMPLATQTPLKSEFGNHQGFAFRHHIAGFGSGEISPDNHMGVLLWFERSGWDNEDFFFFPHYSEFSKIQSATTWGLVYTKPSLNFTAALGMQHQNSEHVGSVYPAEKDSLAYSWAHLRFSRISLQGNFYKTEFQNARLSLDLEERSLYGGKKEGWATYLPNFELTWFHSEKDSLRVRWEQNLWAQRLYGEVEFDFPTHEFRSAALKYYPDPSRMIGFEATCLRRGERSGAKDLLWGGAIDLLFVRLAYNSSYEYERLYHAKGTFIAEFKFDLAMFNGFLAGRGASQSAPMESMKVEKDFLPIQEKKSTILDAKGVRYENTPQMPGGKK